MGNIHALAHRVTALSMACLASAALILVTLSGTHCSFVSVNALPDQLLVNANGYELIPEYRSISIGVHCTDSNFYDVEDRMWWLSQVFLYLSWALGGSTAFVAWLLSTCWPPNWKNWKLLSILAAATAVLQVPIFLLVEAEPCSLYLDRQTCSLSIGSYLLVASIILWVAVTVSTQFMKPPRWSTELEAWQNNRGGDVEKDIKAIYATSSDSDTHNYWNDGESHTQMTFQGGRPPSPHNNNNNRQHHNNVPSGEAPPPPKNGTILNITGYYGGGEGGPSPFGRAPSSGGGSTRVSEYGRRAIAAAEAGQASSLSSYEDPDHEEALHDHGVRVLTTRGRSGNHNISTTQRSQPVAAPNDTSNTDNNKQDEVLLEGGGGGVLGILKKKSILRNKTNPGDDDGVVQPKDTKSPIYGINKDHQGPASASTLSSSLHFKKKRRMRKQALVDDEVSELTEAVADPGLHMTIVCPDGSRKEASLVNETFTNCILGEDGLGELEEPPTTQLAAAASKREKERLATRFYEHTPKNNTNNKTKTTKKKKAHFAKDLDDLDSLDEAMAEDPPEPNNLNTPYSCGTMTHDASSNNSGDLVQRCIKPIVIDCTPDCTKPIQPADDPNAILKDLDEAARDAQSKPAMRLVDDMKYVMSDL